MKRVACKPDKAHQHLDTLSLIDRYCEVWSEPDALRRAELLGLLWAANATYTDPSVHAANAEQLLAHISKVQQRGHGAKVQRTSLVDFHHHIARFAWQVIQTDGTILLEGLDLAFIAPDGTKIERIIGFFGPLPRKAAQHPTRP